MERQPLLLTNLFEKFISESKKAKRLKPDGSRIKPRSIANYEYAVKYLREFEGKKETRIRIKQLTGKNQKFFMAESKYWKKFYLEFTSYLYKDKSCYDNYVGSIIKIIRVFFNYLNKEKGINTGQFYKGFYVCKEVIPVVSLTPDQLQFLINDECFHKQLSQSLQKAKLIFVFGCTVGLRVSDLFDIKLQDVRNIMGSTYLILKTQKTQTTLRIKLPVYAVDIVTWFAGTNKKGRNLFPPIPVSRFNAQIKQICEAAGWKQALDIGRNQRGIIKKDRTKLNQSARFCDAVSSHTMRRTAITTMLMLGMKEHVVKKITGHSPNSTSFSRYVNYVQDFLDQEMDKVFGGEAFSSSRHLQGLDSAWLPDKQHSQQFQPG